MIILEENFKWHLEAFASDIYIYAFYWCLNVLAMSDPKNLEKKGLRQSAKTC